jgi:integrase
MPRKMTDKGVANLKPRAAQYAVADPELRGHWIRVQPSGSRSFWAVTRNPDRKQVWSRIGPADAMGIEAAREQARGILNRVRAGLPAFEPKAESFGAVLDNWFRRHIEGGGRRSRDKVADLIARHITPDFRARDLATLRRSDITALLDEVEDGHSALQADHVLTVVRAALNWHASRTDYIPPLVRGMRRTSTKERARDRILSDDEIRAVWKAAEANGTFGALVRMLLVTAQRLDVVISMKWADLSTTQWPSNAPTEWTIPWSPREKQNAGALQLPAAALAILDTLPRFAGNPFVFAGQNGSHISKSGKYMQLFRAKLPAGMPSFRLHDLRRTARSLMSRAGVRPDIAERVLGHTVGGTVQQIYDRHLYLDEKSAALAKLTDLVDGIVNSHTNVVSMAKRKG